MKKNLLALARPSRIARGGFTLIEFVVIISIFAIVAGVGLFNIRGFQNDMNLTNLAQDLALLIRRVQSETSAGLSDQYGSNSFTATPRGIAFTIDQQTQLFSQTFTIFDDVNEDAMFDQSDTVIDTIQVQTDDSISQISYVDSSGTPNIITSDFAITFKRPFPEPIFYDTSWEGVEFSIARDDGTIAHIVSLSALGELGVQ